MNRDESLLNYIKNEILVIKRSTITLDQNSFLANDEKQRAVCMTLINIGEAVKQLSAQVKLKYKYVDWKGASSFRDVAAHKYGSLRMDDVWDVIENDLSKFEEQVKEIKETISKEN